MLELLLLAIVALAFVTTVYIFNNLVRTRNLVKNAFSQIDVQLKRRYDLIPNLVEVAKGYMAHEKETLEKVIQARNQASGILKNLESNPANAGQMGQLLQAEGQLGQALSRLMMVAESYPDLKANTSMAQLTEELTSTENKVSFARQAYNDAVMVYNNLREVFPNTLIAASFGFTPAATYEITVAQERENVKVSFGR